MEKIQNTIINVPKLGPKLVNLIAKNIRFRTAQFVPQIGQSMNPGIALGKGPAIFLLEVKQPFPNGNSAVRVLVENNLGLGHTLPPPIFLTFFLFGSS